ncbi:hypothetical protein APS56_04245 [Pseudalgibacter alginicilyticus]|uniref:IgGFc-binding protein N-terminal domain-containing protein n=1 Tax=Pseudalgibacter alginicilyticus TaxID=1736674 RepID=A0A0P0CE75_9FLAO|nr:T9SS type B sorting domain-containing protein [Pseudalgibacter alginicilyticus]ALJ04395.1 hypothetical protein APS56_04245 [Pseudalgibacter alginicilyticus]
MFNKLILKCFFFIVFNFSGGFISAQLSKTHYIPPLTESGTNSSEPEDHYIYISTPKSTSVSFTIKPVGLGTASYITGSVSNTSPFTYNIGSGRNTPLFVNVNQTSTVQTNKGYIIEAQDVIYVSVRINAGSQAGALVSKGLASLGTTFRVGSYTNENPQSNYLNFVSVMATEDNTQVSFSDLPSGLIIENYSGTTPVITTLNKGESYTLATNSYNNNINRDGLIGCLVTSDKPIVVNCGSTNGSFHNGGGRDYGIDQIVDLSKVGTEYIFVKGDGANGWENVLIVAHSNNTSISINGGTSIATVNAGDYYLIEGNQFNNSGNMYVQTSQPVFVYQGVGATTNEANQGMFFVPPLSCETRGNLDNIANIQSIGNINYTGGISIVTKVGATVTINNSPINNFSSVGPNNVNGKSDYVTYKVTGLSGNISVESTDELYCAYFNFNGAATSGSFYSGFPSPPEINFDAQFVTLGNCIPNVKLKAANIENFDSFQWFFDDGTGYVDMMITTAEITPLLPGKYKLAGIITCTGELLESIEVPISICPDDIDNDGIIDNLDVDNDNDGILNYTESKGNAIINLSDFNDPELIFEDFTRSKTILSGSYTQSNSSGTINPFSGNSSGGFTSVLESAAEAENTLSISFTEPVNIKFEETISLPNTNIDGEYFIVKISPINKNITLVDPDNHLLIDSNFDGIFESGVTQISGSEIHFKINPSPTGNTPFQFLANQVDGFTFIHTSNNATTSTIFNGGLSLTSFKKDTDLDGIEDALDLDSDNDGIPDFIENTGTFIPLSGIDIDLNGLDDAYDITTLPTDTDGDGIYDFYDLDSDNDGIYDLYESGSGLPDLDMNGIVDGNSFGTNGWADAAETTPDSSFIGYILNDLDADNIFSYLDSDSDGDGCTDVIEAGFSDGNGNTFLGDNIPTINYNGLVNNASDGYTLPNSDYLTAAPISIITQPINTEVCELLDTTISVISDSIDTVQWEVSTDGISWAPIIDNTTYNGSQSSDLKIYAAPLSINTYKYRAFLNVTGNSCGLYTNEVNLTVYPQPIVNPTVVLIQCDDEDASTVGYSPFNLTEANDKISANAANEIFTYFLTQAAAISGDITNPNYISNPTAFTNRTISTDVIWARIESQLGCPSFSEITLNVSSTAIPSTFLVTFNQCDDFLDINGNNNSNNDDRDGIATFDFSSVTATLLSFIPSGQNPLAPRYYRNKVDALAEVNEITNISNYRNIGYPGSQNIYVRIDSAIANDCLGLGAHILLNVEPLPIANPVTIPRQCDYDLSDTILSYPFDTSQLENNILNGQNPLDVTISYYNSTGAPLLYADGTAVTSPIQPTFLTENQTITIRVTNNVMTDPNGPCYDETDVEFIVDEQPIIANTIPDQIVCDNGNDGTDENDGLHSFNTSTFENIIKGTQSNMDIYFNYLDKDGTLITKSNTLPNPLVSSNQTISVEVVNPNNSNCSATTTINLIVNPIPEFSLNEEEIVCTSDPTFTVVLEALQTNSSEIFNYKWIYEEDGTELSNSPSIVVSSPGAYTATLENPNTLCSKSKTVFVKASEIATISLNDIEINDFSENNTVTIKNPTNLGVGSYEFSLESKDGTITYPFQENPVFNNVRAGLYTLLVRDAICGTTTIDISVVGYFKFFTPNGDGYNDTWQIKGISSNFQSNSFIYIYDRYGKLLKELNPLEIGWNGTYNGSLMPNDDYWFKVLLEDGRTYTGHFTLKR